MVMVMMILLMMMRMIKTSEEWKCNNQLYNLAVVPSVTGTCASINAFSIVNKSPAVIFHDFIHHYNMSKQGKKNINSSLSFGEAALTFSMPRALLVLVNGYSFKPQYSLPNSPNWSPYISLKNYLRDFDKRSKHFP